MGSLAGQTGRRTVSSDNAEDHLDVVDGEVAAMTERHVAKPRELDWEVAHARTSVHNRW